MHLTFKKFAALFEFNHTKTVLIKVLKRTWTALTDQ